MRRLLSHRYTPAIAVIIGILAMMASLDTGLAADDYLLAYTINGGTALPWSAMSASGLPGPSSTAQVLAARDLGLLPWTADPAFRFSFLRPLSMLSHTLDFRLWPSAIWLMHLHSVAWFALFLAGGAALVRRIEGAGWGAGLAVLLLAVDDAHGTTVGWIANRNLVMAAAFGVWSLWCADRERDGGRRLWAPLLLGLGLMSNEGAIGWWPLMLGHAAFVDTAPGRWRRMALMTALCVTWVALWVGLGFGVHGSGIYADITADPSGSLAQIATNLPLLALSLFAGVWAELFSLTAANIWMGVIAGLVCCAIALVIAARLGADDRRIGMWTLGAFGALLPVTMSFPSDRLLLIASLPAAALLSKLVVHLRTERRAYRLAGLVAAAIVARHIIANIALAPLRARSMQAPQDLVERGLASLDLDNACDKVVVLLNPPTDAMAAYAMTLRAARSQCLPKGIVSLYSGLSSLTVQRPDAHTLIAHPDEPWMAMPSERLSRDPATAPFLEGDVIELPGLRLSVESVTADGRPATVRATFDAPLSDPRYQWHQWGVVDFVSATPVAVGHALTLPPTDAAAAYFNIEP